MNIPDQSDGSPACYLVSNSPSSTLLIAGTDNTTVDGNGATFEQTSYACDTNDTEPVLTLQSNANLSISDVTLKGPYMSEQCGGDESEGDYGVLIEARVSGNSLDSRTLGNDGVTMNGVTIEDMNGDGITTLPLTNPPGDQPAINWNFTFENGTLANIGYHGLTPQSSNGFDFVNNTVSNVHNFIDLEDDGSCFLGSLRCYDTNGNPIDDGQWNVVIDDNFLSGGGPLWLEAANACDPQKNWYFIGNTLDSDTALNGYLLGRSMTGTACPRFEPGDSSGIFIENNVSAYPSATGYSSGQLGLIISGFTNVVVTGNASAYFNGCSMASYTIADGSVTNGSTVLTDPSGSFSAARAHDPACIRNPGAALSGTSVPKYVPAGTNAVSVMSSTELIMSSAATCSLASCSSLQVTIPSNYYEADIAGSTSGVTAVGLCNVSNATVADNDFQNTYAPYASELSNGGGILPCPVSNSDVKVCNNTYGLTNPVFNGSTTPAADPENDEACSDSSGS